MKGKIQKATSYFCYASNGYNEFLLNGSFCMLPFLIIVWSVRCRRTMLWYFLVSTLNWESLGNFFQGFIMEQITCFLLPKQTPLCTYTFLCIVRAPSHFCSVISNANHDTTAIKNIKLYYLYKEYDLLEVCCLLG